MSCGYRNLTIPTVREALGQPNAIGANQRSVTFVRSNTTLGVSSGLKKESCMRISQIVKVDAQ